MITVGGEKATPKEAARVHIARLLMGEVPDDWQLGVREERYDAIPGMIKATTESEREAIRDQFKKQVDRILGLMNMGARYASED